MANNLKGEYMRLFLIVMMLLVSISIVKADDSNTGMLNKNEFIGKMSPDGKSQLIETKDGNFLILLGRTLYKYDSNLNLIKSVDIKKKPSIGHEDPMPQGNMD